MIKMRIFLPLIASYRVVRVIAVVGLAAVGVGACGVDSSGLNSMPFLPHDAAVDAVGAAGATGTPGSAGSGVGTAGVSGGSGMSGSGGTTGIAGSGGTGGAGGGATGDGGTSGAAGSAGTAGTVGVAGNVGTAGNGGAAGSTAGTAGSVGTAGSSGTAGVAGTTGTGGTAGVAGTTGTSGTAGTGVAGSGGRGGVGGIAGAGGTVGGRGGTGGVAIPCTPTSCADGCCKDSTTCIRMRSAMQCGAQGATCAPCGGCQICSSVGQCRIDATSRWKITAISAQLDNSSWDRPNGELGGAAPDPFCEFENPAGQITTATAGVTDTVIDTYNVTWNQEITPPGMTVSAATLMANSPTWQIWVGDDDGCIAGQSCLGDVACTIRQAITETQLRSGQLVVNNRQSCSQVTIGLVCQPLFPASEAASQAAGDSE